VVSVAEATTLQLEFRWLAQLTGEEGYWRRAERVMQVVNKARIPYGLAPIEMRCVLCLISPSYSLSCFSLFFAMLLLIPAFLPLSLYSSLWNERLTSDPQHVGRLVRAFGYPDGE
jgi:hypothetical protein